MCGFVGFTGTGKERERVLGAMCARLAHRGPDAAGCKVFSDVALGHRRLSVLDPDPRADQPFCTEDGQVALVYNGEIYNADSLRAELAAHYAFRTACDTEVLLAGYLVWGEAVVTRLRGMFAFVVYDARERKLFGGRDRFGIKPFYYTFCGDDFVFASEYKAFLAHPNFRAKLRKNAILPYLTFEYNPERECFLEEVFSLAPAHTFTLQNGQLTTERYADLLPPDHYTAVDTEELSALLAASVAAHTKSDVPLGAFLSGGVDSGLICALARPRRTFSVGFPALRFNETDLAGELCRTLDLSHEFRILSRNECFTALSDIQYHMDDPHANPSAIPLWFLAKSAAKHVKVVLSGEGADELFGGYDAYADTPAAARWHTLPAPLRHRAAKLAWQLPRGHLSDLWLHGADPADAFLGQAYLTAPREARALLRPAYRDGKQPLDIIAPIYEKVKGAHPLVQKQYLDCNLWLVGDILQKADKMTMAHGLELRVPFLDNRVFAAANGIPPEERRQAGIGKYPLRQAAETCLPHAVAWRTKKGFPVPVQDWFRSPAGSDLLQLYFSSEAAHTYFEEQPLRRLLTAHLRGKNCGRLLYAVLAFLLWEERYLRAGEVPLLNTCFAERSFR